MEEPVHRSHRTKSVHRSRKLALNVVLVLVESKVDYAAMAKA